MYFASVKGRVQQRQSDTLTRDGFAVVRSIEKKELGGDFRVPDNRRATEKLFSQQLWPIFDCYLPSVFCL
jgi:hypothetical protein